MVLVSVFAARKGKHPSPVHQVPKEMSAPRILVHAINEDRCVGCDACVAVCPTNVLDLVSNKSRVLRFQDCIQCEACMWACPTDALVMHPEGTEPPTLKVPEIDANFQTAVPGQYLIGEVAGKPLVKNAANLGRAVVEHMLQNGLQRGQPGQPGQPGADGTVDVAIVGSGPGGLSAALTCIRNGLSYVVLEKEQMVASTVSRYPKGKLFMAEPYEVRNLSFLPVFDSSKEEIVPIWEQVVSGIGMNIKMGEPVESVEKRADGIFDLRTTVAAYTARRVVLAIGTRGKPRTLGVPGENLPKVQSLLEDPADYRGQAVLVVGGGDSAVEAAMALADAGARVVLSYRGKNFGRAQKKNQSAVDSYAAQKKVKVLFQSTVEQLTADTVTLKMGDGQQKSYPNQAMFVLIGADPPVRWLNKVGVQVVERPHSYSLGKTDEVILGLVGEQNVVDCPDDANLAVVLTREGRVPEFAQQQIPQLREMHQMLPHGEQDLDNRTIVHFGGARKLLRSATSYFTSAFRVDQPMPLSEFANQRKSVRLHTGEGRRDSLSKAERTRVLRMLRDEGGRLADEDTRMLNVDELAPPAPPMFQQPPTAQPTARTLYANGAPAGAAQPPPPIQQYQQQQQQQQYQQPQYPQPQQYQPPQQQQYQQQYQPPPSPQQPPPQSARTLYAHGAPAASQQGRGQQYAAPPAAQGGWRGGGNGPGQQRPAAFDEEPTRQADGDAALAMLLDGNRGSSPGGDTLDAAATQAMSRQAVSRYGDPLTGGDDEPTRIGHMGELEGEPEEPTRAVDMSSWMQSGAGNAAKGDRGQSSSSMAATRALDLSELARTTRRPPSDDMPTRDVNVDPRPYPHRGDRGPHGKPK